MVQFTQVKVDWYNSTFLFYIGIIAICFIVADRFQNTVLVFRKEKIQLWSVLIGGILLAIKGFGTTGTDLRGGYYYNFCRALSMDAYPDYSVEVGFRIIGIIIRNITNNYAIFIFIVACMTILPIIKILKKYKDIIDFPAAVLLYTCVFYFTSFSALRAAIATALALYAFDAMVEKKPYKALVWIFIASLFHTSVLILIIPYVASFWKVLDRKIITVGLILLFAIVFIGKNSLMAIIISSNDRYAVYSSFDSVHIGMEQIVYYLPLFWIYNCGRKLDENQHFSRVAFAYLATGFCFGLLGYIIPIFGRFKDVFLPIIIVVPYYLKLVKKRFPQNRIVINICVIAYCIMRFYVYISQYYNMEDLMPYTNFFGLVV